MGKISKKKQARINLYKSNPLEFERAFVRVTGAITALIEDIELANSVMPEIYPDSLVIGANACLNSLYSGKDIEKDDPEIRAKINQIADVQLNVANMYREVNEKIK
jgi:hypothetical protein